MVQLVERLKNQDQSPDIERIDYPKQFINWGVPSDEVITKHDIQRSPLTVVQLLQSLVILTTSEVFFNDLPHPGSFASPEMDQKQINFFPLQILHFHFAVFFFIDDCCLAPKILRTSTVFVFCSIRWLEKEMSGLMRIGRSCREGSDLSPPSCLVQVTCDDRERLRLNTPSPYYPSLQLFSILIKPESPSHAIITTILWQHHLNLKSHSHVSRRQTI